MRSNVPYSAIDLPEVMSRNQAASDIVAGFASANALAAMRATIGAQRDGEPDPLYYIRDELSAPQNVFRTRGEGDRD